MRKFTLKPIITAVLTAAIIVTGINTSTPVANAAKSSLIPSVPTYDGDKSETIILKPGDTKQFTIQKTGGPLSKADHNCGLECFVKRETSDENVVKVELGSDPKDPRIDTLDIIAVGSGTATITSRCKHEPGCMLTIPVKVELPKATKKQSKCKHKYKVTKKATCERAGIKSCKKCKFQKELNKIAHEYVDREVNIAGYEGFWFIIECQCGFKAKLKCIGELIGDSIYTTMNNVELKIAPDSPYPSYEATVKAYAKHSYEEGEGHGGSLEYEEDWGYKVTTEILPVCQGCGDIIRTIEDIKRNYETL